LKKTREVKHQIIRNKKKCQVEFEKNFIFFAPKIRPYSRAEMSQNGAAPGDFSR